MIIIRCALLFLLKKWKAIRKFIANFCDFNKIFEKQTIIEKKIVTYTDFDKCSRNSWKNDKTFANNNMTIMNLMMIFFWHTLKKKTYENVFLYQNRLLKHYSKLKLISFTLKKTEKHIKIVAQHKTITVANLIVMIFFLFISKL